jgi:hypothetical protein
VRKLKLQMQVTVDGYVAGPEGQLDWMTFDMDAPLLAFINHLTDTSDTILLGRKMTDGFVKYWEQVVTQKESPEYDFAQKMVDLPKVVFSKTLARRGRNVAWSRDPWRGEPAEEWPGGHRRLRRRHVRVVPDRARADRRDEPLRQPRGDRERDADLQGEEAPEAGGLHGVPVRNRGKQLPAQVARPLP